MSAELKKFQVSLRPHKKQILNGTILAIDPGSISLGWAWFIKGEFIMSGEYKAPSTHSAHKRLMKIMDQLQVWTGADVLAIEKMFRFNASLIWSVGSTITTIRPDVFIEVPIRCWQQSLPDDYVKSDEQDAVLIGQCVIDLARKLK